MSIKVHKAFIAETGIGATFTKSRHLLTRFLENIRRETKSPREGRLCKQMNNKLAFVDRT